LLEESNQPQAPRVNPTEEPVGPPPPQKALQTGGDQRLQGEGLTGAAGEKHLGTLYGFL